MNKNKSYIQLSLIELLIDFFFKEINYLGEKNVVWDVVSTSKFKRWRFSGNQKKKSRFEIFNERWNKPLLWVTDGKVDEETIPRISGRANYRRYWENNERPISCCFFHCKCSNSPYVHISYKAQLSFFLSNCLSLTSLWIIGFIISFKEVGFPVQV